MGNDLWNFIWENKKWWMIPPIIVLLFFGALVFLATSTPVSPFIYALF